MERRLLERAGEPTEYKPHPAADGHGPDIALAAYREFVGPNFRPDEHSLVPQIRR